MATIWEDNFESGNALAVSYEDISIAETNATCGRGGGWGARGNPLDEDSSYAEFYYRPATAVEGEYFRVKVDIDSSDASGHLEILHLRDENDAWFVALNRWLNNPNDLFVSAWGNTPQDVGVSADGVWTAGVWATVQLEVWMSTGTTTPNADGRIRVTVDGVEVINVTNAEIWTNAKRSVPATPNRLGRAHFGPGGNLDSIGIYTDEPIISSSSPSISPSKSSSTSPSISPSASPSIGTPVGMRLRLWNETLGVSVGESALINSTIPVDASFMVTLSPGVNSYKLQVTADESNVDLFVSGAVLIP